MSFNFTGADFGRLVEEQAFEIEGIRDENPLELQILEARRRFAGSNILAEGVLITTGRSTGYEAPGNYKPDQDELLAL